MMSVNLNTIVLSRIGGTTALATNLQIYVTTSGAPITLTWDGTNNSGTDVTPGTYEIQLHWDNGQGATSDISRSVIVVGGGGSGLVVAHPNVLQANLGNTTATFDGTGITNASTLNVNIYTITGELVSALRGPSGPATVTWNASGMASGLYVAAAEVQNASGGVIGRQTTKVLVLH
jgi:flagellar hook assembly protein FlgD